MARYSKTLGKKGASRKIPSRKRGKKSDRKGKPRKTRLRLRKAVGKRNKRKTVIIGGTNNKLEETQEAMLNKLKYKYGTYAPFLIETLRIQAEERGKSPVIPVQQPHDFLKELIKGANEPPPSGLKNQAENPIDKTIAAFMNEILKAMMKSGYDLDTIITPEIEGLYEKTFLKNIPINEGTPMADILKRDEIPNEYKGIKKDGKLIGYILTFVLKTNNKYIHKITVKFNGKEQEDFENHEYTHKIIEDSLNNVN